MLFLECDTYETKSHVSKRDLNTHVRPSWDKIIVYIVTNKSTIICYRYHQLEPLKSHLIAYIQNLVQVFSELVIFEMPFTRSKKVKTRRSRESEIMSENEQKDIM